MSETALSVTATAPAKINLALYVGSPDISGFHPLLSAFQAINLFDSITVHPAAQMNITCRAPFNTSSVPLDETNIVWKAHALISAHSASGGPVRIDIDKTIPVAGGMAGGSADGAASLIALNELWQAGCPVETLFELARQLGSDVPFSLVGGAAIGRGRGDVLQPFATDRPLHVVVVTSGIQLSTPLVYATLDAMRGEQKVAVPDALPDEFLTAWRLADAHALAPLLHNDLEPVALSLEPSLGAVMEAVSAAGALRALVSGSGPTVVGLAESEAHAVAVAQALTTQGFGVTVTQSTGRGSQLQTP